MRLFRRLPRHDRGAVAVEFALILPIFLLLVYGGLAFGLAMSAKGVITEAAAEGARAAISAQLTSADNGSMCAAYERTALKQTQNALISAGVNASYATITTTPSTCQSAFVTGVMMTVAISYPYGSHPTIPNAPGLGAVLPATIFAQYTVQVS